MFSWLPLPSTWCLLSKYWCLRCVVLQLPAVPPLQPRNILVEDAAVGSQRPRWPAPLIPPTCCVTSAESLHLQKFTFFICLRGRIILPTPCDVVGTRELDKALGTRSHLHKWQLVLLLPLKLDPSPFLLSITSSL